MTEKISYLHFNNPMNPFLFIGLLIIFLFFFWKNTFKLREQLVKRNYLIIFTFQSLIFTSLLVMITEPVIKQNTLIEENAKLIVLFDGSQSTFLRKDTPWKLMFQNESQLYKSLKNYEPEFYIFSEIFKKLDPKKIEIPKLPPNTKISENIENIINQTDSEDKNVLLLFSDGQDLITPEQIDSLKLKGIPIYTVGLGSKIFSENSVTDLSISKVTINDTALLFNPEEIKVTLRASSNTKDKSELNFSVNSEIFEKRIINIIPGKTDYEVNVNYTPLSEGLKELSISASKLPSETDLINNTFQKTIKVIKDSSSILFIENGLNLESLYLKKFIHDTFKLNIDSLTIVKNDKIITDTESLKSGIPQKNKLFNYGLIVLYNPNIAFLNETIQKDFEQYISERGGNLLIIFPKDFYNKYKELPVFFKNLLPFTHTSKTLFTKDTNYDVNIKNDLNLNFFTQKLPVFSNIIVKINNPFNNFKLKDISKPLFMSNNEAVLNSAGFNRYGKGSIFYTSFNNSWNWQFDKTLKDFYSFYWSSIFNNLIKLDNTSSNKLSFKIHTEKDIFLTNEIIRMSIIFNNEIPSNINEKFSLTLKEPSGTFITLPFQTPFNDSVNIYSSFIPEKPGTYEVEGSLNESKAKLVINIRNDNKEFEDLSLNETNLILISEATNAFYKSYEDYLKSPFIFERNKTKKNKIVIKTLWNTPLFIAILLTLFTINWIIRKNINIE